MNKIDIVKTTGIIANVVLGIGVLGGVIAILAGLAINNAFVGYRPEWTLIGCGLAAIVNSAIIWAVLQMLVTIYSKLNSKE